MGRVNIHTLLCCFVISLSWGSVVKRELDDTRTDDVQTPVAGGSGSATRSVSYGIVCDAGSTSTRVKVYQVKRTEKYPDLPRINLIHSKKFLPSLDAFVNNKLGLKDYVTQIIDEAKKIVPQSQLRETFAYLGATAGLRFLKPHVSGQLIKNIIEIFDNLHINHFRGREGIAVLSGEEEAAYSWVAANYLLGKFARNRTDWETVGLLEMGGGSTQIAFVPKHPIYSGEFQININGRPYDLYVHSYLQFGINAVQVWVAKVLSQLYPDSRILGNPCMLKGDVKEIEVENKQTLLLHGTSDPEGCKRIFKQILAPEKGLKCEPKPCAVGNVYQPSVDDIKFYAIQGFTLAPKALNVLGPDQILDIDLLEQEAFKYCRKNLSEAVQTGIDASVASTTCLLGIYTPTLLTLSYDFPRSTTDIQATDTFEGELIEWSLGVMVLDVTHNSLTRRRR